MRLYFLVLLPQARQGEALMKSVMFSEDSLNLSNTTTQREVAQLFRLDSIRVSTVLQMMNRFLLGVSVTVLENNRLYTCLYCGPMQGIGSTGVFWASIIPH